MSSRPLRVAWPCAALLLASGTALAATEPVTAEQALFWVNNLWMLMAAFMVFLMHLGFATLESGMTRAKNSVNILFKNLFILAIGLLTYAMIGFNLMYPGEAYAGGFFGFSGFGVGIAAADAGITYADGAYTYWTDFLFQGMFAATAATIVSGAVAERVRLGPFLIFSAFYVALVYPIVGMWQWGGGWLAAAGFHDFAGSTIVHGVGGWAALAGAWYLGPRIGRYESGGMAPHNLPLAAVGALLLWFGWYGFNGGSVLSADPVAVSYAVVTTTLAAASGLLAGGMTSWALDAKPDLGMVINGTLAGLVGVTAGADVVSLTAAVIIGVVAGVLVYGATALMDSLHIDDPVGAVPVHLVGGIWGTLAVGLFSADVSLATQALGVVATGMFCLPISLAMFYALDKAVGLRVSAEEEECGLDLGEHGIVAYGDFLPAAVPAPLANAAK
jgi:Amt family ammonium transporter